MILKLLIVLIVIDVMCLLALPLFRSKCKDCDKDNPNCEDCFMDLRFDNEEDDLED